MQLFGFSEQLLFLNKNSLTDSFGESTANKTSLFAVDSPNESVREFLFARQVSREGILKIKLQNILSELSKGGESLMVKCVSQSEVIGMDHGIFYWPEKIGTESKIFIKGLDPSVCELFVAYVPSVADLKATDEIFVPNGSEIKIFQLLKELFLGQRQVPEDTANDNKEQPIQ